MKDALSKKRNATHSLSVRLLFYTYKRKRIFEDPDNTEAIKDAIESTLKGMGCELLSCEFGNTFAYIEVRYLPKHSVVEIVNNLKGRSSRLFQREKGKVEGGRFWDRNYIAVSDSPTSAKHEFDTLLNNLIREDK